MAVANNKTFKLLFVTISLLVIVELISAPFEWLWPASLGGTTYYRGSSFSYHPSTASIQGNQVNANDPLKSKEQVDVTKIIALTFDDGPSSYTSEVLDILKSYDAKATFFVMGREVERYPEIVARIANENHELGNHAYQTEAPKNILFSDIDVGDIEKTQSIIEMHSGQRPILYRSPGGLMGRFLYQAVRKEGLRVIYGHFPLPHPADTAEEQLKVANNSIYPGAIIILHDGDDSFPNSDRPQSTVELLPDLLENIYAQGFEVRTVSELLNFKRHH